MDYTLAGQFLEACDCTVICPCWVDDDPVGGHCTGFILWDLGRAGGMTGSTIDGRTVTGCRVVSVSTHSGKRRDKSPTTTVVYVDTDAAESAPAPRGEDEDLVGLLGRAFSGEAEGPLADLAAVSGTVVDVRRAHISPLPAGAGKGRWSVDVVLCIRPDTPTHTKDEDENQQVIHADGRPEVFDEEPRRKAKLRVEPLTLDHTALSYELRAANKVVAQSGEHLSFRVGALPGGHLEVTGRSGMRGTFRYEHATPAPAPADGPQAADGTPAATSAGGQ